MLNSLSSTGRTPWRMEKERGMEERSATPALQEFPQLSLLHFLSPQNQDLVKDYLVYIRARRYGPAMQEGTIRALKNFLILMPEVRQATLAHDLTQTTATDVDAWLEAAFRRPLAPSTVATRLRGLHGFFAFLHDQQVSRSPRRNALPVKRIDGALLMGHKHLAGARIELKELGKTSSCTNRILQHAPEACDGVAVMSPVGRSAMTAEPAAE